jgi:hypothetical protein
MLKELDNDQSKYSPGTARSDTVNGMLEMLQLLDSDEPITIEKFMGSNVTPKMLEDTLTEFRKSSPMSPEKVMSRFSNLLRDLEMEEIKQQEHEQETESAETPVDIDDEVLYAPPSPPRRLTANEMAPTSRNASHPARPIPIEKPAPPAKIDPPSIALQLWRQALGRHLNIARTEISPGKALPLFTPPPRTPELMPSPTLSGEKVLPSIAPNRQSSLIPKKGVL